MTLTRAIEILAAGSTPHEQCADRIVLTYDERHRRRMRYIALGGTMFLLDLPRAAVLQAGDALRLEDGRLIRIEAQAEPLLEVSAPDPRTLVRLAWHIGNRHLHAQIEQHRILIREDSVIAAMLRGLGATVVAVCAPFTPETGAYAAHTGEHAHAEFNGPVFYDLAAHQEEKPGHPGGLSESRHGTHNR